MDTAAPIPHSESCSCMALIQTCLYKSDPTKCLVPLALIDFLERVGGTEGWEGNTVARRVSLLSLGAGLVQLWYLISLLLGLLTGLGFII